MLVTSYLFLGGAGAGALVVLAALECLNARRRFSLKPLVASRAERAFALPDEFFARSWPACFVVLVLGILCLLADIGRPDRLLNLLVSPEPTPIAVGAYALVVSLACAGFFSLFSLLDAPAMNKGVRCAVAVIAIVAGAVAATYTGVLLQSLASVLFWQTPLLPALFVLSSLSCGVAIAFAGAAFVETRKPFARSLSRLAIADGVLIVLEALVLTAFVLGGFFSEGAKLAASALVYGDLCWLFWGALVTCGLAVPFVLERFITHGNSRTQLIWIAAFLLVGGFALRFCVVGTSEYDATQMHGVLYGLTT